MMQRIKFGFNVSHEIPFAQEVTFAQTHMLHIPL